MACTDDAYSGPAAGDEAGRRTGDAGEAVTTAVAAGLNTEPSMCGTACTWLAHNTSVCWCVTA